MATGVFPIDVDRHGRGKYALRFMVKGDEHYILIGDGPGVGYTEKEAAEERAAKIRDAKAGKLAPPSRLTVPGLLSEYVEHRVRIGKVREGKSRRNMEQHVRNHLVPVIGARKVGEVDVASAQSVIDKMVDSGKAPSTINAVRAVARGAFDLAVRRGDIQTNPFRLVDTPTVKLPDLDIPTPEVAAAILAKSDADAELGPALRFAAGTGARAGEVAAVRWADVFLTGDHEGCELGPDGDDEGIPHVHLRGTMARVHGTLTVTPPKTRNGLRAVPLSEATVRVLEAHKAAQSRRRLKLGPAWKDGGWAFDGGVGEPVDPDALGRAWRKAREAAGHEGVRLHDLRHLWITYVSQESDIGDVSKLAGHGNPGFTLMRYSHPTKRSSRKVAAATGKALGDALGG